MPGRLFLAFFLFFGLAVAASAERRVALVIGDGDYRHLRRLDNPVNDARAVGDLLKSLGFEVTTETDRDLRRLRRALDDFREDGAGADVAVFFYAGHGVAIGGVNYLLPIDAVADSSDRLKEGSLPLSEVQETLAAVAPVSVMLLDACRDDPFAGGAAVADGRSARPLSEDPPGAAKPTPGLGRIGRADGVLFAFAAAPNETASDGSGANSPFTSALLRHFATKGVELKSALTLVQQDVYDRSRGRQLPYIESGLPKLVFISGAGDLPERDRLLMAMAGLTPDLRDEVEKVAAANDMPLAPLYGALITGDLGNLSADERQGKLEEAARAYAAFTSDLAKYASEDPRVSGLRARAEEQLALGSTDAARALLGEAIELDRKARLTSRDTYLSRTLSEASTHVLSANAARTDLRYDLAIADLNAAVELYAEIEPSLPDRETRLAYLMALQDLGDLQLVAGNSFGALGAITTRAEFAEKQAKATPDDTGWTREMVWALKGQGDVLVRMGYLQEASAALGHAFDFSRLASERNPDDLELKRDREVIQNMLGEVAYAMADYPAALAAHREALAIAEDLLDRNPRLVTYLKDISYIHERIGDNQLAMGDRAAARDSFDVALRIDQDLSQEFPDDIDLRAAVAVGYERLGDMVEGDGDHDSALAVFMEAQRIRDELVARDPGNMLRRRELTVVLDRIAGIYGAMGDTGSALMTHMQVLTMREALVALDPANSQWTRDLSVTCEDIGQIHYDEGDFAGAEGYFTRSRLLREEIVTRDPGHSEAQRDLGLIYGKLASTWGALGDDATAIEFSRRELETYRSAVASNPQSQLYREDVGFALMNLGALLAAAGDAQGARAGYEEAVALRGALVAEQPESPRYLSQLVFSRRVLVDLLVGQQDDADAVAVAEAGMADSRRLLELGGDRAAMVVAMSMAFSAGDARTATGDPAGALSAFRVMADMAGRLVAADPQSHDSATDLALAQERVGTTLIAMGDSAGAIAPLEEALGLRRWLLAQEPEAVARRHDLRYCLQNLADALDNGRTAGEGRPYEEEALAITRQILAGDPGDAMNAVDLAAALYRVASYDPAAGAALLREGLALLEDLDAAGRLPGEARGRIADFRAALGME